LITGGSRGLGREIALAYAHAGADVVVSSRKVEACEDVAREIESATGRRALAVGCHVGRWDALEGLADAAYAEFGHVDVLVNNAGMSPLYDSVADVGEDLFDKVLAVNLKGPFRLTAIVGTRMAAGAGGSIVNIGSSGATMNPRPHMLPYAAAKSGLIALTVGFSHAFGPSVRVNCILPGPILTDVSQAWDMEHMTRRTAAFALGRPGQPDEVVGAAVYFASDASTYTTGACLRVDGGER
jgi:NAD(P)-dependent dehydrogenase (short-subunit alcohol dehydrogenase family)